jgi:hypothetical protein
VKRTTAKGLTAATALAVAGVVAGAGTLSADVVASPDVEAASYSVANTSFEPVALASRSTFAERASREAARVSTHLAKIREAKKKAAAHKKAVAHKKAMKAKRLAAKRAAAKRAHLDVRPVTPGTARALGKKMAARHGWTGQQWAALDRLWQAESNWRVSAGNPGGAYGIPQALPGTKMSRAGGNWRTSASTQIEWGLDYIAGRWGSPARAWGHFQAVRWY